MTRWCRRAPVRQIERGKTMCVGCYVNPFLVNLGSLVGWTAPRESPSNLEGNVFPDQVSRNLLAWFDILFWMRSWAPFSKGSQTQVCGQGTSLLVCTVTCPLDCWSRELHASIIAGSCLNIYRLINMELN